MNVKMSKMKRILSVLTLVLAFVALVVASIGASFSFAWFSKYSTANVQDVNLNSKEVINIGFSGIGDIRQKDKYKGQTAFKAVEQDPPNLDKLTLYTLTDALDETEKLNTAFECRIPIKLTANDKIVNIKFTSITISLIGQEITILSNNINHASYGFTWYVEKKDDASTTKIVYYPYGKCTKNIVTLADGTIDYTFTHDSDVIRINEIEQDYYLYVVFCPERLYWSSRLTNKVLEVNYTADELAYIYNNTTGSDELSEGVVLKPENLDNNKQLYYSKEAFMGAEFNINMQMSLVQ